MLKKYSNFNSNECKDKKDSIKIPSIEKPVIKNPKVSISKDAKMMKPISKKPKEPKAEVEEPKLEENLEYIFDGKVVNFKKLIKPSDTLKLLESKNISKEKLHYIITEQNNSLVVLKYNIDTDIKLNIFSKTLLDYYNKNEKLKNIMKNIEIIGTETYAIIKNIPNLEIRDMISENIKKLLK